MSSENTSPRPAPAGRGIGRGVSQKVPPPPSPLLHKCVDEGEKHKLHKYSEARSFTRSESLIFYSAD